MIDIEDQLANASRVIEELRRNVQNLENQNKELLVPKVISDAEKRARATDAVKIDRLESEVRRLTHERDAYFKVILDALATRDLGRST